MLSIWKTNVRRLLSKAKNAMRLVHSLSLFWVCVWVLKLIWFLARLQLTKLLNDLTQLWIFLLRRAVWTKPIYLKDWTLCSFKVEFREPCLHWRPASLHFNLFRRATQLLRIHPSFLPSAPKTSGWKHRNRSDPAYCMSMRCLPSYGHDKDKGRPPPRIVC